MSSVDAIVKAASKLDVAQFTLLRRKLDRLEKTIWEAELKRVSSQMHRANVTDKHIDRLIMTRRYEGRP